MAAEGLKNLLHDIGAATSDRFQGMLDRSRVAVRDKLLLTQSRLKSGLNAYFLDKLGFWKHGMYRTLAVFYCEQGGWSFDDSRRVLGEVLNEYDEAVRAGRADQLHRITKKYLAPGTLVRIDADKLRAGEGNSIADFPHLYVFLQTYSLASLVERRVEQIHSLVKSHGQRMKHVLPPYLCASLRADYNISLLRNNREFYAMCIKEWRSRTLVSRLLSQRFSKSDLATMKQSERIKRVYQSTGADEYKDLSKEFREAARFSAATLHHRTAACPIEPDNFRTAITYFKSVLQVGCFYSLPTSIYSECVVVADNTERARTFAGANPVSEAIVAIQGEPEPFDMVDVNTSTYFQVKHCHPEKRVHVDMPHLPAFGAKSVIHVYECSVSAVDADGVRLFTEEGKFAELDAVRLAARMSECVQKLQVWSVLGHRSKYKPSGLQMIPIPDAPMLGVEPSQQLPSCRPSSSEAIAPAEPLGVRRARSDIIDVLVQKGAWVRDSAPPVLLTDVDGWCLSDLRGLEAAGAVALHSSEFGELEIRLNRAGLVWTAEVHLGNPTQLSRAVSRNVDPLIVCKLDLALKLVLQGFSDGVLGDSWTPDGGLHMDLNMRRPISYFQCLVQRFDIITKGAVCIPHRQKDGYYKCLLRLPASRLQAMLALEDHAPGNDWYLAQIKDVAPDESEGENSDDGRHAPKTPDLLAIENEPPAPTLTRLASHWHRQKVDVGEGTPLIKVYFDHASEEVQRGFCPSDARTDCCKWMATNQVADIREYCAKMYAWHQYRYEDNVTDKQSHLEFVPTTGRIEWVAQHMRMWMF